LPDSPETDRSVPTAPPAPFAELAPPYSTIVADPPWHYAKTNPDAPRYVVDGRVLSSGVHATGGGLPYAAMSLGEIKALPVGDLTADGRCFLWTTNRYLRHSWDVLEAWGFEPQDRTLVWCKAPRATMPVTTEFVLIGKKGNPPRMPWHGTTWFQWPHTSEHSAKPDAFGDLVESWCPGPYVELFCRRPRLGWDSWGKGYEIGDAGAQRVTAKTVGQ
jgi:N6-adenosine-specific RNA methylase IME4